MNNPTIITKEAPFKHFCMSIGAIPTSYKDSLDYYENVLYLIKYLEETVIPVVNNNGEAVSELQRLYIQLKDFVENYFTNLDVQEEINNKLDEMVESGELEGIIGRYINVNVQTSLNLRRRFLYKRSLTDLYNDVNYSYLQGFCKIEDDIIVMGIRNANNLNNIVDLVEYKLSTNQVLRHTYLTLNHCNDITYDETNKKLYVATSSKIENNESVIDNDIIKIDYETFTIESTIQLSNITSERIRSLSYDNTTNTLYAGNVFNVYKINLTNNSIVETINLSTNGLDTNITNQVIKKYKNYYVGLFLTYMVFWNSDGSLYKVINIEKFSESSQTGEVEDFYIEENGDIIIGSVKLVNDLRDYRNIEFYYSNIYINTSNELRQYIGGNETAYFQLYVDSESNSSYENGTNLYPYKDLQTAITKIANFPRKYGRIVIKGGTYEGCRINGCNALTLSFQGDTTINGLIMNNSDVYISNDEDLIINGIEQFDSKLYINGLVSNKVQINAFDNDYVPTFNGKCLYLRHSEIYCVNAIITGDNSNNTIEGIYNSNLTFENVTIDDYEGHYAFYLSNHSTLKFYSTTFNISVSNDQKLIYGDYGSIIYPQNNTTLEMYEILHNTKVYNYVTKEIATPVFIGDICENNNNFKYIRLYLHAGGNSAGTTKIADIPTTTGIYEVDNHWMTSSALKSNAITINVSASKLSITNNRHSINGASSYNYTNITETPSESTTEYISVEKVEFYN